MPYDCLPWERCSGGWGDSVPVTSNRIVRPSWRESRIIARLIREHNLRESNMIERRPKEIRNSYFWIARKYGKVAGSIGLIDWGPDGVEIVSHLTHQKERGEGIGKKLLEHAVREAKKINPSSIFLFTTETEYYKKCGFAVTDPRRYPRKLKERCQDCPKSSNGPGFPPCPEIAMEHRGDL